MKLWVLVLVSLLVAACAQRPATTDGTIDSQISKQLADKQALAVILMNSVDLDELYFTYYGSEQDAPSVGSINQQVPTDEGIINIGELNVLLYNIGDSATAGGLYVSGYDPNLIHVDPVPGETLINTGVWRNCYKYVGVSATGHYDVTLYCDSPGDGITFGGRVTGNPQNGNDIGLIMGTLGNIPLGRGMDWIAEQLYNVLPGPNKDIDFFTKLGIFDDVKVDCGSQEGKPFCRMKWGSGSFNPNRASHGFILLNLLKDQLGIHCANQCRPFPANFDSGEAIHGVSADYPIGDSRYYNYQIKLDKSKWNSQLNDLKQTFQISTCYAYTTMATPTVCVDPDPLTRKGEPCTPGPLTFKDNPQKAPIQITKITQDTRPGYAAFRISIENTGGGQVWLPGAMDQCSPWSPARPDPRKMDAVILLDARISGDLEQMQCLGPTYNPASPDDQTYRRMVRLDGGRGEITCLYPLRGLGRNAFQTSLTLEFGYIYSNSVSKQVVIHRT